MANPCSVLTQELDQFYCSDMPVRFEYSVGIAKLALK